MKKITMTIIAVVCILMLSVGFAFAGNRVAHSNAITEDAARNFAFVDAGVKEKDAVVTKTDFDFEHGKYVYEIEFIANNVEYEYDVNATNGKIIKKQTEAVMTPETAKKDGNKAAKKQKAKTASTQKAAAAGDTISVEKAKSIALKQAGRKANDVTFSKAKLERDDGRWIYDIEFYVTGQNEYDYEIDATTGNILDYEVEGWELDD